MESGGRRGERVSGSEGRIKQYLLAGMIGHDYFISKKYVWGGKMKEKQVIKGKQRRKMDIS